MFNNIDEALNVLQERRNMKLGIEHLKALLEELDNPQKDLKCIHIGGTNGKGSTTNYTRSILEEHGYRVGTFTSPHLVKHNDRIRINNESITDQVLLYYINKTFPLWEAHELSMFEIDMLISLMYFKDQNVDWVIYEVGLGGRLDATNVITPVVSAITNIGYDHMQILGNTLAEIAYEKGGIIKQNGVLITTEDKEETLEVFKNICKERQAKLILVDKKEAIIEDKSYLFTLNNVEYKLTNQAIYQVDNATLALNIVKHLNIKLEDEKLKNAIEKTNWPGRFEEILPSVYLDGAHNKEGVSKLVESLKILPKPWVIVFTALGDKEHHDMIEKLLSQANKLIITEFNFIRAISAEELAEDFDVEIIADYKDAIEQGIKDKQDGTLIITGSLYFISEARSYLLQKKD